MSWAQSILFPGNLHIAPERLVDHEECRLEVRVAARPWRAKRCVFGVRAPVLTHLTGSPVLKDAALLNLDMSERLRAEIGYISECRNEDRGMRVGEVEAADKLFIDPPERDSLDPGIPDDLLNKVHCETDGIHIG